MNRTSVAWDDAPEIGHARVDSADEAGWRAFLTSWKLGALLVVGCVLGLVGIVSAHPFASASASERVARLAGEPAACVQVGGTVVGGAQSGIYHCTVGWGTDLSIQCYSISGSDVRQLASRRYDGC